MKIFIDMYIFNIYICLYVFIYCFVVVLVKYIRNKIYIGGGFRDDLKGGIIGGGEGGFFLKKKGGWGF